MFSEASKVWSARNSEEITSDISNSIITKNYLTETWARLNEMELKGQNEKFKLNNSKKGIDVSIENLPSLSPFANTLFHLLQMQLCVFVHKTIPHVAFQFLQKGTQIM